MKWFWTWRGLSFGYRSGDSLFTYHGDEVARFHGQELYDADGDYLGEVLKGDRLVTRPSKKSWREVPFVATHATAFPIVADHPGYAMYTGYTDFPSPETIGK